jgi:hypothetical protein
MTPLPRKTQYQSHSHPHVSWLREYSTTPATNKAVAFRIIRFRVASCAVLNQHAVNLRASFSDLGRVSNHITLRKSASSSIGIFVSVDFCVGGVASCPLSNRAHSRRRGLGEREEQLFLETLREKNFLCSAASVSKSGQIRRQRTYRSVRDALSATPIFSSQERASPMPALRTPSWAKSSANRMVSRHRFDGIASPVIRGRTGLVAVGPVCSLTSGLRPSSDHSLLCARPVAIEHTGGHRHASNSRHAFAWHHHLLSDRSGALSPPCTGAENAGGARDRRFRKGADGGSPVIASEIPAAGYAALRRGARNPRFLITGSGGRLAHSQSALVPAMAADTTTALKLSDPSVAVVVNQSKSFVSLNSISDIGSARETSAMLHPGAVDGSTTKLAGRDSGDRAERRSTNSLRRAA